MTDFFITGKALVAGVMGWPVEHTKSPKLHGYWLKKYNIDGVYIPMPVSVENIEQALRSLPVLGFRGCNLTIPHKEEAMKYVDSVDSLAKRVGAINTVIVKDGGRLEASNTDVYGFSENLKAAGYMFDHSMPVATLLGAGGAARAAIVAMQDLGFHEIRVINRSIARAEDMVRSIGGKTVFKIMKMEEIDKALIGCSLLANTTSLGMVGHQPLDINIAPLPKEAWVTDVVYTPLETDLLRQARQRHMRAVDGLGMLLHQARAGFKAWFGQDPEVTKDLRDYMLGEA